MAELSFGEKLLIARKQLNLYQYEMAEQLGVHPNSLAKYERGEGKPHAAVLRMFEILCEQHDIRFDEYEAARKEKGDAMKIVLAEKVSPATLAVFAAEPGWEVLTHDQLPDGLPAALSNADALVVRSAVKADDALMSHAPKLRVIGRAGVGVDNIDAAAATRRGIVVMNTPGANAVAVAELTIGLMLTMARKVPAANASMHGGKWEKKIMQGTELRGKTLGVLGLGRIGMEVAKRARGMAMEIIGCDPFVSAAVARENGIKLVTQDELFAGSDYITLHVGLTPHIAGSTAEAQEAVGVQIARQVRDYLKLGVVQNAVNMPSLSHEEYVVLAPYISLAERMGSFMAQAGKGGIDAIHLVYGGKLAEAKTDLVRNAAIAGLLAGSENVNRINAATVAEARGIRIHEEKQESHRGGGASVLTIELHTPAGSSQASATVIRGEQPRLLAFDGIDIETPLEGNLLVCRNLDVPGVIGKIGSTLGEQGVNIANFALGRERSGAKPVKALAVVQVDAPVSDKVLEALKSIEAVLEAKSVQLPEAGL